MASELAPVTPAVLRWARVSIGATVEDAAKRAGVTAERLESWEDGNAEPTVAKLRALAKFYGRPLAVFFLPAPPAGFQTARDFRRLPGAERAWSRALHKVFRRAVEQHDIAVELLEDEGTEPHPTVPAATVAVDPEDAGALGREALGVSLREQLAWRSPEDAVAGWIEAVEHLGAYVLRTSDVELAEMRGFSISDERIPVIVVNALDAPRGQVFTLLHEFAHLMLREGGVCDLAEPDEQQARTVELWCNAVAGALLMPASSFLDETRIGPAGSLDGWDDEMLVALSHRYGVSREAVLRRLVTLQRASLDDYFAKRAEYLAEYARVREEERERRRQTGKGGGAPPYRMAVRDRGRPYVRLVLDAYHGEEISASTAADFLGLKLQHFPKLEAAMRE